MNLARDGKLTLELASFWSKTTECKTILPDKGG